MTENTAERVRESVDAVHREEPRREAVSGGTIS